MFLSSDIKSNFSQDGNLCSFKQYQQLVLEFLSLLEFVKLLFLENVVQIVFVVDFSLIAKMLYIGLKICCISYSNRSSNSLRV